MRTNETVKQSLGDLAAFDQHSMIQIFNSIPIPIFYKDNEGVYRMCNRAFLEVLGKGYEDVIGHTAYDIAPRDLAEAYHQADLAVIGARQMQTYEGEVRRSDGSRRDIVFYKSVILRPDGSTNGLVGAMIDITERKRLDRTMHQDAARRQALLSVYERFGSELPPLDALVRLALEGAISACGSAWGRFVVYDERRVGTATHEHSTSEVSEEVQRAGLSCYGEAVNQAAPALSNRGVRCMGVPLLEAGRIVAVIVLAGRDTDYTELDARQLLAYLEDVWNYILRVDAQKRSRAASDRLVHADRLASLGKISAGIAHEINTPIAAIRLNLEMLAQAKDPVVVHKLIEQQQQALDRIADIVRSLRAFARQDTGGNVPVALHSAIDGTLAFAGTVYEKAGITIDRKYRSAERMVFANQGKIQQVLLNLISNAVDAMDGQPERRIWIETFDESDFVVMVVRDSGRGIPAEDLGRIFDPFFTTKEPGKGTGLGLSITQSLVESMDATILVESEVGRGAQFSVRFRRGEE